MIYASVAVLLGAFLQAPPAADSTDRAVAPLAQVVAPASSSPAENTEPGPRVLRVAFVLRKPSEPYGPDAEYVDQTTDTTSTTSQRPRAVEHSDAYYTRLKIHRVASYTELPLFAAEYVLGERLLKDERTGFPPSSLKTAHAAVAGGLGVLFTVNTITGVWNLWDSRHDPANHTLKIIHSVAMLGADAGFALAGATGGNAKNNLHDAQQHRTIAVSSIALATAGTAIMWLFNE
ncbi:MAG: hypothetical protein ACR2MQ_16280 [Gemmatimonadaceae bacterium]